MISFARLGTAALVAAVAIAGMSGSASAGKAKAAAFNYSLSPGSCTGGETVPQNNKAVQMMGSQVTVGYRGVGQATLIAVPSYFLEWVGSDVYTSTVSSGFSGSSGTHITYLDYSGYVDVQVYSPTQVQVCNSSASPYTATGTVEFLY